MKWLVRLYPREWRRRYEEEFGALLEECRMTPFVVCDILVGAINAHFRRFASNWRALLMTDVTRTAVLTVFCAVVAFCLAGLAFYWMVDDSPFVPMMSVQPALGASWLAVEVGSVIAALAVLAGGIPVALAVWRGPRAKRRLCLLGVAAITAIAILGVLIIAVSIWLSLPREVFGRVFLVYSVAAMVGVIASSIGVAIAVARSDIGRGTFRFAFVPALVTTLAMGLMTAGTIFWGMVARVSSPQTFDSTMSYLGLSISYADLLLLIVTAMAVCTGMALISVVYGIFLCREGQNGLPNGMPG